jgi:5-methylcytosine-specific restriction endonuclease McrA
MPNATCSADECTRPIERREWCNAHYRRLLKAGPLSVRQGTCQDCGASFTAPGTGPVAPRCRPCANSVMDRQQREWHAATYVPVIPARVCFGCGEQYNPPARDTNSLNCVACRIIARREVARERARQNPVKLTDRKRLQLKAAKHRRRVRIRFAHHDYFTALDVFERDEWACKICGLVIDPNEKFPSRDSASLDHIVPLALGGTHTLDNVQTACMGCNWAKGARLTA